jgi:hypothetical protein
VTWVTEAVAPGAAAAAVAVENCWKQVVKLGLVKGTASAVASAAVFTTLVDDCISMVGSAGLLKIGEAAVAETSVWVAPPNSWSMVVVGMPRQAANAATAVDEDGVWVPVDVDDTVQPAGRSAWRRLTLTARALSWAAGDTTVVGGAGGEVETFFRLARKKPPAASTTTSSTIRSTRVRRLVGFFSSVVSGGSGDSGGSPGVPSRSGWAKGST